jgi:hypothetical protein
MTDTQLVIIRALLGEIRAETIQFTSDPPCPVRLADRGLTYLDWFEQWLAKMEEA